MYSIVLTLWGELEKGMIICYHEKRSLIPTKSRRIMKKRILHQSVLLIALALTVMMAAGLLGIRASLLDVKIQLNSGGIKTQSQSAGDFLRLIEGVKSYQFDSSGLFGGDLSRHSAEIVNALSSLRFMNPDIVGSTLYLYDSSIKYEHNSKYSLPELSVLKTTAEYGRYISSGAADLWVYCNADLPAYSYMRERSDSFIAYFSEVKSEDIPVGFVVIIVETGTLLRHFYSANERSEAVILTDIGEPASVSVEQGGLVLHEPIGIGGAFVKKTIELDSFNMQFWTTAVLMLLIWVVVMAVFVLLCRRLVNSIFTPLLELRDVMYSAYHTGEGGLHEKNP